MFGKKTAPAQETNLYTIFDSKSKTYDVPFHGPSKEVIIRDLINQMNDPKNQYATRFINAEDFSMYKVGTFDQITGQISSQNHEHQFNYHDIRAMSNWRYPEYVVEKKVLPGPGALNPT